MQLDAAFPSELNAEKSMHVCGFVFLCLCMTLILQHIVERYQLLAKSTDASYLVQFILQ
jgi:hypothetical protein